MDDILSQGGDRDPSPWPRRLALIGALVLAAVASVVYASLAAPPASPEASPSPASSGRAAAGLSAEPDGIGGPTVAWDGSLRLPVTGTQPAWLSPATGHSEPIGGLPGDSAGYQFTRIGGGWAVQASTAGTTAVR